MYVVMWEFIVKSGREAGFKTAYGPQGDWARLFKNEPGYRYTQCLQDLTNPRRYVVIDVWDSREHYRSFLEHKQTEYRMLDEQCESYTEEENHLGEYQLPS